MVLEVIGAIGAVAGLALFAWKKWQDTPDDKRRKSMNKLDNALKKAKNHNSVKDIAKWLSKRI